MQSTSATKPYIGGQAVIEGVMMRAPCVHVRRGAPSRRRRSRCARARSRSKLATSKLWKLPGLRGVAQLVEAMSLGYGALRFSAEQQMTEEERAQVGDGGGKMTMVVSTLFALALFIALPQAMTAGLAKADRHRRSTCRARVFHR